MASFLTLPREIRDKIYYLALHSNTPISPFVSQYEALEGRKPYSKSETVLALGLLATNKQVREECIPISFGQNMFYVASFTEAKHAAFWTRNAKDLRLTQVALDVRDFNAVDMETMRVCFGVHAKLIDNVHTRRVLMHTQLLKIIIAQWALRTKLAILAGRTFAVIDVTNAYCPQFCCYLGEAAIKLVLKSLDEAASNSCPLQKTNILFLGLWSERAWAKLHDHGFRCPLCMPGSLHSDPKTCDWKAKGLHGHSVNVPYEAVDLA